jgi:hypothetical protein
MFLTNEEVVQLTGRKRHPAQVRALRGMGIEHRVRPDGSVAVLRALVDALFGLEKRQGTEEPHYEFGLIKRTGKH